MKKKIALMLTAAMCCYVHAALLDMEGTPFSQIVVEAEAPDSVRLAARELQRFLVPLCGAELPLREQAEKDGAAIYLGKSALALAGAPPLESLPQEGFWMRSSPGCLAIAGPDYAGEVIVGLRNPWRRVESYNPELKLSAFGEAGTLAGVYDFLEREGGVRFYLPGELGEVCEPLGELRLKSFERIRAPRFAYRYPWFSMFENSPESALWARRVGFGAVAPVMIIHSYDFFQKYKESNPEYFALAGGKRAFGSECVADGHGHLCLTNPAVIRRWADDIIAYFESNPEVEVYPLAPNDGLTRICECAGCQAELRPEAGDGGTFSYHIWNFTGKVASLVAERFPNKYVGCLAYEYYRKPPEGLELPSNVAVMFCHARSALTNPGQRDALHAEIEAWSKRVTRIYFWNWYLTHWQPWNHLPVVYTGTIRDELRYMAANPRIFGEFIENEGPGALDSMNTPGMQHWNMYVTAKLYWEPEADTQAMQEEYFEKFYGPAAPSMGEFWRRTEARRMELMQKNGTITPDQLFPPEFLQELENYLTQAAGMVEADSLYGRRVALIADEFAIGRKRLTRLLASGHRRWLVPQVTGFEELEKGIPERMVSKEGEAITPPGWIYAGYDRRNLYLSIICFEPEMAELRMTATAEASEKIWEDDTLEIFFTTTPESGAEGFQIVVNPAGALWDQRKYGLLEGDPTWSSEAQVELLREATRWRLRIAVPLQNIGVSDPNFVRSLGFNLYRNRLTGKGSPVSCWSPTGEYAHYVPEQFGTLDFQ